MSNPITLKIDAEKAREMPMVDLAFEILKSLNTPLYYRDLMMEIAKIRGLSEEDVNRVIAQVYTEINIDGRFACVGSNLWGLKRWYPVEKADDAMGGTTKRPRIINDEDDDLDDEDLYGEEEEEVYDVDTEDYDSLDEDREDIYADDDTIEEEVAIDDDELGSDESEELLDEELDEADEEEEESDDEFEDEEDEDDK